MLGLLSRPAKNQHQDPQGSVQGSTFFATLSLFFLLCNRMEDFSPEHCRDSQKGLSGHRLAVLHELYYCHVFQQTSCFFKSSIWTPAHQDGRAGRIKATTVSTLETVSCPTNLPFLNLSLSKSTYFFLVFTHYCKSYVVFKVVEGEGFLFILWLQSNGAGGSKGRLVQVSHYSTRHVSASPHAKGCPHSIQP